MSDRIQIRRDAASVWTSINPILSDGEFGYERDTNKIKIGNGVTPWNTLPYYTTVGGANSAIAGEALGGHRAVIHDSGLLYYADTNDPLHINKVVGLTTGATASGFSADFVSEGVVIEPTWSWSTLTPVYLGSNGLLTQSPINVSGFRMIVGTVINSTTLYVSLKTPILL